MAGDGWGRLTERAQFQRVGRGRRIHAAAFTLQANVRERGSVQADVREGVCVEAPRFGLTVTKKTGNSPVRHRIKRRLREAMARISALDARADHDYVLLARTEALSQPFETLVADIAGALRRVHSRPDASKADRRDARP